MGEDYLAIAQRLETILRRNYSYLCIHEPDFNAAMTALHASIGSVRSDAGFVETAGRAISMVPDPHLFVMHKTPEIHTCIGYHLPRKESFNMDIIKKYLDEFSVCGPVTHGAIDDITYVASLSLTNESVHTDWLMNKRLTDKIILDLRPNGGGSDDQMVPLASYALGNRGPKVAQYLRYRTNPDNPLELSEFRPSILEGESGNGMNVILLIGPRTMSSAESTALRFAAIPGTVVLGDVSAGSSGRPVPFTLNGPNAGKELEQHESIDSYGATLGVRVPSWLNYRADKILLEGNGIVPHKRTPWNETYTGGKDVVLEQAIDALR